MSRTYREPIESHITQPCWPIWMEIFYCFWCIATIDDFAEIRRCDWSIRVEFSTVVMTDYSITMYRFSVVAAMPKFSRKSVLLSFETLGWPASPRSVRLCPSCRLSAHFLHLCWHPKSISVCVSLVRLDKPVHR